MKLSELIKEAKDIDIAAVPETLIDGSIAWYIYIINKGKNNIHNVMIQSNGRGEIDAWPVKTSTLRHFINNIAAGESSKVEMLVEEVFFLENQYWVSYYIDTTIFDSQLTFAPNSIAIDKCENIPLLNVNGVVAK
ncbi:MAG: hypothetical protein RJA07_2589 [Bacteroidota bacterium]|jgi:hypothetical protein